MVRKSEKKTLKKGELYEKLAPKYFKLINGLKNKYKVVENPYFSDLVNFKQNRYVPKHSWFVYKQGYSENLVKALILQEKPSRNHFVLDPFAGVGTTNLVAQSLGYKSVGFDINPVATFAAEVKTIFFKDSEISRIKKLRHCFTPISSMTIPQSSLLENSFSNATFEKMMKIKGFIEQVQDGKMRNFFKLAYLSIVEDCSNRLKDGNGIKIVKNKPQINDIFAYFLDKVDSMLKDVQVVNYETEAIIFNGSITRDFEKIRGKRIGIVIFSPPYANCFDYCEVYKLELWMGEFVKSYEDFRMYRDMAVRSHVNATFDHTIKYKNPKVDLIAGLISCFNIWNKNIPDMIRGYFDDMTQVLEMLKTIMVKGAKCFIVVGNSGYKGILVPTDLLLAEIGENLGFRTVEIINARKLRASSQQMEELNGTYGDLMRESIVVLERL